MNATAKAPDIRMIDVQSSQIHSIGHDPETNTLAIRFFKGWGENKAPGSLYHYRNFSVADFEAFRTAESIGSHFGKNIKNETEKYPFHKIVEPA